MKTVDLIIKAGFASSKKEAQRFIKQGAVRYGWTTTYHQLGNIQEWEKIYLNKEYIELLDAVDDINHSFSDPYDDPQDPESGNDADQAFGWYLFVGKRNAIHVPAIFAKNKTEKFKLVMDIKETP